MSDHPGSAAPFTAATREKQANLSKAPIPRHEHDCDQCVFLGPFGQYDLYFHPNEPNVVARSGPAGDYQSGLFAARHLLPLREAALRAQAANLLPASVAPPTGKADLPEHDRLTLIHAIASDGPCPMTCPHRHHRPADEGCGLDRCLDAIRALSDATQAPADF